MQYFVQGSEVFRIHRIQVFFGLPDPDPIVRGMDPALDPDPDPIIIMQKPWILLFCALFDFFIFEK
jgi:hypothetical protein